MALAVHVVRFVALLVAQCLASDFLGIAKVSREDLEAVFLSELANAAGSQPSAAKERITLLEKHLSSMYSVVPKEADGTLSHSVVRYVLHRFFVHHHGWFIRGLEPGSESIAMPSNTTKVAGEPEQALQAMQEWIPSYLQKFLEGLLGGRGANLRDLAAFAATLEDFIQKEEHGHLLRAFNALNMSTSTALLDTDDTNTVLQTYMMIFMLAGNFTARDASQVSHLLRLFSAKVASWPDTIAWLEKVVEDQSISVGGPPYDYKALTRMVEKIGDQYSVVNDKDCGKLKQELMKMESTKPGRVRLADFYKKALFGSWEFNEKIEYLRSIGTIDESDPSTPLVILPNYIASRPNCLTASSFYVVCCRNECEDLMERLEADIGSSSARPSRISKVIAKLPSDTVAAPRNLTKPLMQRLQEIADIHEGKVPLHGRLFAQWMHHAYPRECPFPHATGTSSPLTPDEWMQKTGQEDSKASSEEMISQVNKDSCRFLPTGVKCGNENKERVLSETDEELPWDSKEELLVVRQVALPSAGKASAWYGAKEPLRDLLSFLALSSILYAVRTFWRWGRPGSVCGVEFSAKDDKFCV